MPKHDILTIIFVFSATIIDKKNDFCYNISMDINLHKGPTTYYCDFLFGDIEFTVFLDTTFFNPTKLPPTITPVHNHSYYEILAVLDGTVFVQSGDNSVDIESSQVLFCPAKLLHSSCGKTENNQIVSICFTFKKSKTAVKIDNLYSCFSEIFNQEQFVVISDPKIIFDNLSKLKTTFNNLNTFSHFKIQTLLQEIILEIVNKLFTKAQKTMPFLDYSYGKNLPYLINLKINSCLNSSNLKQIASELFISTRQIERYIKKTFGVSFLERKTYLKLETAKKLLRNSKMSVDEIVAELNFSNKTHFYKKFYEHTKMTPGEYRKNKKLQDLSN